MALFVLGGFLVFLIALQAQRAGTGVTVQVEGGSARVGAMAPDFATHALDGSTVRLSGYRGKPVLLNFWATWCTACQAEMPLLQRAADRYGPIGLTVLAVNYRQSDTKAMQAFLKRVDVNFPALFDPGGRIATAYGVNVGLPVSVFIDRAGRVSFIQLGQMSSSALEQQLHSIL